MSNEDPNKELGTDTANISDTKTSSIPKPQISSEDTDPLMIRDTDTKILFFLTRPMRIIFQFQQISNFFNLFQCVI